MKAAGRFADGVEEEITYIVIQEESFNSLKLKGYLLYLSS
jgi:hypothetical protein